MKQLFYILIAAMLYHMLSSWTLKSQGHSLKDGIDKVFDEIFTQEAYKPDGVLGKEDLDVLHNTINYFNLLDSINFGNIGDTLYLNYKHSNDGNFSFWLWNKKENHYYSVGKWYIRKNPHNPFYYRNQEFKSGIINWDSINLRKSNDQIHVHPSSTYYIIRIIADKDGLEFEGFKY